VPVAEPTAGASPDASGAAAGVPAPLAAGDGAAELAAGALHRPPDDVRRGVSAGVVLAASLAIGALLAVAVAAWRASRRDEEPAARS
jgi:hypothetical protein